MRYEEPTIKGCNVASGAFRSGGTIDKLFVLDGCQDGSVCTILREARKYDTIINYASRERLDQISKTGKHQGVITHAAACEYAEVEDTLRAVEEKGEPPFPILLDDIEGPHNLGAIIRMANLVEAHGVTIPKHRVAGPTATVVKTPAEALNCTLVVKVINLMATMEDLKEKGMWFVCADMGGELTHKMNPKGSIEFVVGNKGEGVGKLVRKHCDMAASTPIKGDIGSLNVSVATDVLAYEIVRQRLEMQPFQR